MIRDMDKNLEESNEYSFASMTKVQVKAIQYAPSLFWEQRLNASCPRINATSVERTNIQADSTKVRPKAKKKIEPTKKKPEPFAIYVFLIFYMKETEKKKCVYSNACDFSSICTRRVLDCCLLRSLDVVPLKTSIFYGRNDRLLADNVIEISLWYGKVFSPIPPVILPKLIVQGFFFFCLPSPQIA